MEVEQLHRRLVAHALGERGRLDDIGKQNRSNSRIVCISLLARHYHGTGFVCLTAAEEQIGNVRLNLNDFLRHQPVRFAMGDAEALRSTPSVAVLHTDKKFCQLSRSPSTCDNARRICPPL